MTHNLVKKHLFHGVFKGESLIQQGAGAPSLLFSVYNERKPSPADADCPIQTRVRTSPAPRTTYIELQQQSQRSFPLSPPHHSNRTDADLWPLNTFPGTRTHPVGDYKKRLPAFDVKKTLEHAGFC